MYSYVCCSQRYINFQDNTYLFLFWINQVYFSHELIIILSSWHIIIITIWILLMKIFSYTMHIFIFIPFSLFFHHDLPHKNLLILCGLIDYELFHHGHVYFLR